jgi:uncharacterized membrane protein
MHTKYAKSLNWLMNAQVFTLKAKGFRFEYFIPFQLIVVTGLWIIRRCLIGKKNCLPFASTWVHRRFCGVRVAHLFLFLLSKALENWRGNEEWTVQSVRENRRGNEEWTVQSVRENRMGNAEWTVQNVRENRNTAKWGFRFEYFIPFQLIVVTGLWIIRRCLIGKKNCLPFASTWVHRRKR